MSFKDLHHEYLIKNELSFFKKSCELLHEQNIELKKVLKYYANKKTWQHLCDDEGDSVAFIDLSDCYVISKSEGVEYLSGGKRAIETLKEIGEL